jgi:hypothetical protein
MGRRTLWAPRRIQLAIVLLGWIAGWAIVLLQTDGVVGGDLPVYHQRVLAIEAGGIPYLDPVFEHLPGMLVPLFAARVLSVFGDAFAFAVVFSALMALCVLGTARLLDRVVVSGAGTTFVALAAPMIPLIVFRNDAWVTLLAVAALIPVRTRVIWGILAILSKGWPLVLAARVFASRSLGIAAAYMGAGVLALSAMRSPGFSATQDANGLHSETVAGSILGLTRMIGERDLGLEWTTAMYLETPSWAFIVGPLLALIAGIFGLAGVRRDPSSLPAIGVLVGAVILASPLFSTQYVFWILPFVVASSIQRTKALALTLSLASFLVIVFWNGLFVSVWWWSLVVVKNVLFIGLIAALAHESLTRPAGSRVRGL